MAMISAALLSKIESLTDKVEDWARLPAEPLVSVYMITYNHEKFIGQALDGILMQEVDFPYEIMIGEDQSTDRTREIVCEYQRRHPDKIRLHLSRENLFSQNLAGFGPWSACRGKYIAICEGDDYWTDPKKLQIQVDCLEKDPALALAYHNVEYGFENPVDNRLAFPSGGQKGSFPPPPVPTTFRDVLKGRIIPTLSAVYRRSRIPVDFEWSRGLPVGDWPLFLEVLKHGPALYLDRVMAVYRQHAGGVWSSLGRVGMVKGHLQTARAVVDHIPMGPEDRRELDHGVWIQVLHCVEMQLREQQPGSALSVLRAFVQRFPAEALGTVYCWKLAGRAAAQVVFATFSRGMRSDS